MVMVRFGGELRFITRRASSVLPLRRASRLHSVILTKYGLTQGAGKRMYRVAQIKIPHRTKCNLSTTVWDFYTQISWFIWERSCNNSEFKKNYFSFIPSYGYINILCHIFNIARNNQQQLASACPITVHDQSELLMSVSENESCSTEDGLAT